MDAKSISVAAGYVGSGWSQQTCRITTPSEAMQLRSKTDAVSTAIMKTACEGSRPRGPTYKVEYTNTVSRSQDCDVACLRCDLDFLVEATEPALRGSLKTVYVALREPPSTSDEVPCFFVFCLTEPVDDSLGNLVRHAGVG